MTITTNTKLVAGITPSERGAIYVDRQVINLADTVAVPGPIALGDSIQIGVIPAGAVLVPELTTIQAARIDTGATGKATIETTIGSANICVEKAVNAALLLRGSDLKPSPVPVEPGQTSPVPEIGSTTDDIPIYLTFTAAVATLARSGFIVCDLALRAVQSPGNPQ
jgi:hypothetical protein